MYDVEIRRRAGRSASVCRYSRAGRVPGRRDRLVLGLFLAPPVFT